MARSKKRRKSSRKKSKAHSEEVPTQECVTESNSTEESEENLTEVHEIAQDKLLKSTKSNNVTSSTQKKYPKFFRFKDENLDLVCEWSACDFRTSSLEDFMTHVENHIPELEVKTNEDGQSVYGCLWASCNYEIGDSKEIVRHVNYHTHHTKIKCIGTNICHRTGVPPCNYHELGRNVIPDIPSPYKCCWEDCGLFFQNAQKFYFHVEAHVRGYPSGNNIKGGLNCNWGSCKANFPSSYKMRDHVRTHTQEKLVGCPVCGGVFATRAKYYDHCKRQLPLEMHAYQCSHCFKVYPSERLLKGHMRLHINHYKCPFCDMTCPGPSGLSTHIRFRHLDEKPYKCDFCEFRSKTQNDLISHHRIHLPDGFYRCTEEGCEYSARSPSALSWHFRKIHANHVDPLYCCHICNMRYSRGFQLTKHLVNKHSFQWPSGHSRFRYKLHEDGLYRLETVRYESLEVTQKMLSDKESEQLDFVSNRNKRMRKRRNRRRQKFTEESSEEEDPDDVAVLFEEDTDNQGDAKKRKIKPDTPIKLLSPSEMNMYDEDEDDDQSGDEDEDDGTRRCGRSKEKLIEIAVEELDETGQVVKLEFIRTKEIKVGTIPAVG